MATSNKKRLIMSLLTAAVLIGTLGVLKEFDAPLWSAAATGAAIALGGILLHKKA